MRVGDRGDLSITMIYISSIIGAGFASGQEILQFFVSYGRYYSYAVFTASIILFYIGYLLIEEIRRTGAKGYGGFVRNLAGPVFGFVFDVMIGIFYFGALSIMMAGSGSLFNEYFDLPPIAGIVTTAFITITILLYGYKGVRMISLILVPALILAGALISIIYIIRGGGGIGMIWGSGPGYGRPAGHWMLSSFLYASYNLLLALGVFTSFSDKIEDRKGSQRISLMTSFIIFFLLIIYSAAISKTGISKGEREIPMLEIARTLGGWALAAYGISLWAAILTTAVANAVSLGVRLAPSLGMSDSISGSIITLLSVIPAKMGFASLISSVYPAFGYAGSLLFILLLFKRCSSGVRRL